MHIPKTAGSSIEDFLGSLGWRTEDLDRSNPNLESSPNWLRKVSPQHWHAPTLRANLRLDRFDLIFAVVRHPIDRFKSEFAFQNPELSAKPISEKDIEDWWHEVSHQLHKDPSFADNHFRPQVDFLLPKMRIYQFESDLQKLQSDLMSFSGKGSDDFASTGLQHVNRSLLSSRAIPVSKLLRRKLRWYYRADFRTFGYR